MANQQLVEYIKQQLQLGVQKDAIKNTLVTSGWPAADIEDAMSGAGGTQAAAPSMTSDIRPQGGTPAAAEPAKKPETQFQAKIDARASQPVMAAASPAASMRNTGGESRSWKRFILPGVMGLVILALAGGAFYLYAANAELNEELVNGTQSNGELTRQNTSLTQEKSNLNSEIQRLTELNASNAMYLTFFLPGTGSSTLSAELKGTLRGDDKAGYTLTTDNGLVFNLKNAKEPSVMNMIKPLINNGLQLTVSYKPGTRDLTITAVNSNQVPLPAPVTASSTTATPASAPAATPAAPPAP